MVLVGGLVSAPSRGCWETSALLCTCVLDLGLHSPVRRVASLRWLAGTCGRLAVGAWCVCTEESR